MKRMQRSTMRDILYARWSASQGTLEIPLEVKPRPFLMRQRKIPRHFGCSSRVCCRMAVPMCLILMPNVRVECCVQPRLDPVQPPAPCAVSSRRNSACHWHFRAHTMANLYSRNLASHSIIHFEMGSIQAYRSQSVSIVSFSVPCSIFDGNPWSFPRLVFHIILLADFQTHSFPIGWKACVLVYTSRKITSSKC
ncbi:hypothetical protein BDZ97DRAFT_1016207 [Flammula alnicola]|nr:hypothetical protein BDZ97DRAFT_1016207 [Flammula alnicola]